MSSTSFIRRACIAASAAVLPLTVAGVAGAGGGTSVIDYPAGESHSVTALCGPAPDELTVEYRPGNGDRMARNVQVFLDGQLVHNVTAPPWAETFDLAGATVGRIRYAGITYVLHLERCEPPEVTTTTAPPTTTTTAPPTTTTTVPQPTTTTTVAPVCPEPLVLVGDICEHDRPTTTVPAPTTTTTVVTPTTRIDTGVLAGQLPATGSRSRWLAALGFGALGGGGVTFLASRRLLR